ncbi:MAG: GntR family transcriptional regulator [Azospirillum brasilense]|nr:MAG: GntR family transcriptional regulator [Azospirillum brasilense]
MTKTAASRPPAYRQAQDAILAMLKGPDYPAGARILSERALAERFGISRMTARHAVDNLVRDGVLERDSTSGTRVAGSGVVRNLAAHVASLSSIIARSGAKPASRLLGFATLAAPRGVAQALGLPREAQVVALRRLRLADGHPFCVEISYLPVRRVPGLTQEDFGPETSLYALLDTRYGIQPAGRRGRLQIENVTAEEAKLLGLKDGAIVIEYRSVVFDAAGQAIEYVISLNHPRMVVFTTEDGLATAGVRSGTGPDR